jgi:hypothetical protein
MVHENTEDPLEVTCIRDEQAVQTFVSRGSHEAFRDAVRLWRANLGPNYCTPSLRNTSSNPRGNVWSRSRIRNRSDSARVSLPEASAARKEHPLSRDY